MHPKCGLIASSTMYLYCYFAKIKLAKYCGYGLLLISLLGICQVCFADESTPQPLTIALEISPFFNFDNHNSSANFCIISDPSISQSMLKMLNTQAKQISPPLKIELIENPNNTVHCQYIFITSQDSQVIQKTLPLLNKDALIIGLSEDIIYSSGHIALLKLGNKFTIHMNRKNLMRAGIRPCAQILKITKTLIE